MHHHRGIALDSQHGCTSGEVVRVGWPPRQRIIENVARVGPISAGRGGGSREWCWYKRVKAHSHAQMVQYQDREKENVPHALSHRLCPVGGSEGSGATD